MCLKAHVGKWLSNAEGEGAELGDKWSCLQQISSLESAHLRSPWPGWDGHFPHVGRCYKMGFPSQTLGGSHRLPRFS